MTFSAFSHEDCCRYQNIILIMSATKSYVYPIPTLRNFCWMGCSCT